MNYNGQLHIHVYRLFFSKYATICRIYRDIFRGILYQFSFADDGEVLTHKSLLVENSEFFKSCIEQNAHATEVTLFGLNITSDIMRKVINCLHDNQLDLDGDGERETVKEAATMFGIDKVIQMLQKQDLKMSEDVGMEQLESMEQFVEQDMEHLGEPDLERSGQEQGTASLSFSNCGGEGTLFTENMEGEGLEQEVSELKPAETENMEEEGLEQEVSELIQTETEDLTSTMMSEEEEGDINSSQNIVDDDTEAGGDVESASAVEGATVDKSRSSSQSSTAIQQGSTLIKSASVKPGSSSNTFEKVINYPTKGPPSASNVVVRVMGFDDFNMGQTKKTSGPPPFLKVTSYKPKKPEKSPKPQKFFYTKRQKPQVPKETLQFLQNLDKKESQEVKAEIKLETEDKVEETKQHKVS